MTQTMPAVLWWSQGGGHAPWLMRFQKLGGTVKHAPSLQDALFTGATEVFDALVAEGPIDESVALLRAMQLIDPHRHLAAIAVTDHTSHALDAGFDDAVRRNTCGDELALRLRRSLGRRQQVDSLAQRIRALESSVLTDPLTGVGNRRCFELRLEEELSRAQRHGLPLSLLMVDVDHFKHVNDRHGHLVGDQVLAATGAALSSAVRRDDIVARYGGEEFAVLLPVTHAEGAVVVAERLLHAVRSCQHPRGLRWTASVGIAAIDGRGAATRDELVHEADTALYRAKAAGRDQLHVGCSMPVAVARAA